MQKLFCKFTGIILLAILMTPLASGQIVVGDTSCSLTCEGVPVDHWYNYTESQYIIPWNELDASGIVTSDIFNEMGWYLCDDDVTAAAHNIEVYLHELPAGPYPQVCTNPELSGALVYTGPLGDCSPTGCCMVTLDAPFTYNGGNLVVTVCDHQSGYSGTSSRAWAANADLGNGIFRHNDSDGSYDCNLQTDDFAEGENCCDSWTTTCFILDGAAPTPTPTATLTPTVTPTTPPGGSCADPLIIDQASIPFIDNNTNCGLGDIYDSTCMGGYDNGEEIIYQINLTTDENIVITLDPQGTTWAGFALHDSCPLDPTTCMELYTNGSSGTPFSSDCIPLTAGTYFLQIDTYSAPDCIPNFTLTIDTCIFATPTPTETPTITPIPTDTPIPPPGDTCSDPIIINCGDCVLGSTVGFNGDHDCGTGHGGVDVVYELTLNDAGVITFIGEADFDADWTIATTCDATSAEIGCWDDTGVHADPSCGTISHQTDGFMNHTEALDAGVYYIWVDSWSTSTSTGDYALEILCVSGPTPTPTATPTQCSLTCPGGADMESEACGNDENGGCLSDPAAFDSLTDGVPMCGTVWSSATERDTDWYEITTTDWTEFTMEVIGEVDMAFGYVSYNPCFEGSGSCDDITGTIDPYNTAAPCTSGSIVVTVPAGIHWFFVAPQNYVSNDCSTGLNTYVLTVTGAPGTPPTGYCSVGATREYEYISNVLFNTIDNASGWDGYGDYTAQSTDVETGSTHTASITIADGYTLDMGQIWIDWNADSDFCDAGEMIPMTVSTGLGPYTADITVPLTATLGATRMRIGLNYDEMPLICGTALDGDYEDYTVNIVSGGPTPTPRPIPATGPAGVSLLLLVIGGLLGLNGFRRRK